jgi:hypothetical protein
LGQLANVFGVILDGMAISVACPLCLQSLQKLQDAEATGRASCDRFALQKSSKLFRRFQRTSL